MSGIRIASTVMLLRDGSSGLQVFMMQRHIQSDFVGGAYVFPGGGVDPNDRVDPSICEGRSESTASNALGVERGGLAYWVAAIRECFEEAGVLLAYSRPGQLVDFSEPVTAARYRELRARLQRGELTITELARREGLRLATDRVHYWAHWITPEGQPRRYDTRFFLALVPPGQTAIHDGQELTDSAWVTPAEALAKAESREWTIIFPTLRNLMLLGDLPDTREAERAALERSRVSKIQPRLVRDENGIRILIPGDPGYDTEGVSDRASLEELAQGSIARAREPEGPE